MLFYSALIQFFLYLFLAPIFRQEFTSLNFEYYWLIPIIAIFSLFFGYLLSRFFGNKNSNLYKNKFIFEFTGLGIFILTIWVILSFSIVFHYDLFNRRIGTENIAQLFSSIPPYLLVVFRSLEVVQVFLVFLVFFSIKSSGFDSKNRFLLFLAIIIFAISGSLASRSILFFYIIAVLSLLQNLINRNNLKKWLLFGFFIGILLFLMVTVYRLNTGDETRDFSIYFQAELLQRLDGLELVSRIASLQSSKFFGENQSSIFNPLISSIPFSLTAIELKAEGLTSVKSVALTESLAMSLKDYNSFIIFDVYYVGGISLMSFSCVALGFLLARTDCNVGMYKGNLLFAFWSASAVNLVSLEREYFSIVLSIFRDTFIYWMILFALTRKKIISAC